jgi:hypothetical protein
LLRSAKFANAQLVQHELNAQIAMTAVADVVIETIAMTVALALNTASHIASVQRLLPMENS